MATSEWAALREALAQTTSRFVDLVKGVRDPGVAAVGTWSIGEVVAHVREVTAVNSLFALELDPPEELRALHAKAQQATMDKVAELNELALNVWSERSPHLLAPAIREQVSTLLDGAAASSGDQQIAWLGRTRVPLKLILGHTLSELFVHGNDIARAMGRSFPLPRQQANLIFEMFLFELLRSPDVATFAAARSTDVLPVACELRLREAKPVVLVAQDGTVGVEDPGNWRRIDVRITADPAAMWLVMNNRVNPARAALTGSVVVWGRRPWRLRRLTRALRAA